MARIFGIDLRTLALFRILLGLAILADIGNLAPWAADFFSDKGVLPRAAALEALSGYRFSLYLANGKTAFVLLLMAVQVLAALALILGWRTRAMTALNWLLLASLVNRNPIILQGGDQLITLLAFWGMFLPLGARFSIDAALDANAAPAPGDGHLSVATAAMLGQVLYVYFFGALLKESPIWIPEGLAVYYATQLDSFATPIGHWLRDQLGLTRALTYFVWSIELAAPFLLLSPVWHLPLRLLALAALVAMHLGFALCLHIGLFWAISIASLSLFVPGAGWDWLGRRVYPPAKRRIALFYDEGCVFCEKTCRLLRTFCLTRDNPIRPAQGDAVAGPLLAAHKSWVVLDADGRSYLTWRAVAFVLCQSPLFWALGRLFQAPWPARFGEWLYGRIGAGRRGLGDFTQRWLPYRSAWRRPGAVESALVGALAALVLWWNVVHLPRVDYDMPRPAKAVIWALNLDQYWNMFAPYPLQSDGWLAVRGAFSDASPIDLWRGRVGEPPSEQPADMQAWYKDYRWRKYISRVTDPDYRAQLYNFARYYCRLYNRFEPWPLKLASIEMTYHYRRTMPPGVSKQSGSHVILRWNCLR